MYCPPQFARTDRAELLAFIAAHPFATLIGQVDGRPCSSSVPLIASRGGESVELIGHVASRNPLARSRAALAVFHGPHAFVSAGWYAVRNRVPTWYYLEVQAEGEMERIDDPAQQCEALAALARQLEGDGASAWQGRLSAEVEQRFRAMITVLRIRVDALHGIRKLSEYRSAPLRARVAGALRARGAPDDLAIAELMAAEDHRIR